MSEEKEIEIIGNKSSRQQMKTDEDKGGKTNFLLHGTILAVASILVRLIGVVYRVPMTKILGTEGSAYYSSAYKIYSIVLLVSSYSMPLAMSKLLSQRLGKKEYKNAYKVLMGGLLFALVVGGVAATVVFIGADRFANVLLNMPLAAIPLRVLAPAIFIMSFLGVFRGFFQGKSNMIPTALSQIFEQIVNAIVSVAASYWLFELGHRTDLVKGTTCYGSSFGAAGGTLGTTMGAFTALLFCIFAFIMQFGGFKKLVNADRSRNNERMGEIMKLLVLTIFPVLISTTAYNLLDIVDQSVFSYYMLAKYTKEEYELIWGAYDNMYMLMLHVPVAISSAMASSTVPAITRSMSAGNMKDVVNKYRSALRFTMLIAIPCAVGLGVLATPIMNLLFGGNDYHEEAGLYLMLGCVAVIFFSLSSITNGILQGLGKMAKPVIHALISLVIHVALLAVSLWVFDMKIYGVIASYIAFGMFMSTMNLISIDNLLDIRQEILKTYVLPTLSAIVMGGAVFGVRYLCAHYIGRNSVTVVCGILAGMIIYAIMLFVTRTVTEEELLDMPKGRTLVRIAKTVHLIR